MDPKSCTMMLVGVTPLLMNRGDFQLEDDYKTKYTKQRGETYLEFEERIWREKVHSNSKGEVVAIAEWFKQSLVNSQRQSNHPIKSPGGRKATDTMKPFFISGVLFEDSLVMNGKGPFTKDTVLPYKAMCKIPSTGGSVPVIRPMMDKWSVTVSYTILDQAISEAMVRECLEWVGLYSGIGDYRPQNGGTFGRFTVK